MLGIDTTRFRRSAKDLQIVSNFGAMDVASVRDTMRTAAADLVEAANYIDDPTVVWARLDLDDLIRVAKKLGFLKNNPRFTYDPCESLLKWSTWDVHSLLTERFNNESYRDWRTHGATRYHCGPQRTPPNCIGTGEEPRIALLGAMKKAKDYQHNS